MPTTRNQRLLLRRSRLLLIRTDFDNIGDSLETEISNCNNCLQTDLYPRLHIALMGSFELTFGPDELPQSGGPGAIFPTRPQYQLLNSTIKATALEPNSVYYCIVPVNLTHKLIHNSYSLEPNQTHTLNQHNVYFVFGTAYTVNTTTYNQNDVIACENNSATLTALTPCLIQEFRIN